MKKIVLTGIRKMESTEVPEPQLVHDDEVKIKIASVGVCGSDIHYYAEGKIGSQVVQYPFAVGHECSGIIAETGKAVTNVKVGDLVVIDPSVYCGECDQCKNGRPHTCRKNRFLGCPGQLDGCLTEYIVLPSYTCFNVTGRLNPVQAALIEPLTIGVYSVKQAQLKNSSASAVIFGAGPIGLSILFKLLSDGMNNIGMVEPLDYRLKIADSIGAAYTINPDTENVEAKVIENEPILADVAFEASGKQEAVNNALKILKPGGKLILVGIPPNPQYCFDMDLARRKEITFINIRRQNHCVEEAIEQVVSGKIEIEKLVTHYFQLEQTANAFEMVEAYADGAVKAIISL